MNAAKRMLACVLVCAASTAAAASSVFQSQSAAVDSTQSRRLVFDPPPNTRIAKTTRIEHALEMVSLKLISGGESARDLPRIKLVTAETLSVDDEYRTCADGRPTSLWRAYVVINHDVRAFALGASEPLSHLAATSSFTGLSVVFTWAPEEHTYGRLYDAREGVEEALPKLNEDLDLRGLLPSQAVRVGERWEIEPMRMRDVLAGAGRIPLEWTPDPEAPALRSVAGGLGGALFELFGDQARGRVVAELASLSKDAQDELAHVELTIELETSRDQTELMRSMMTRAELRRGSLVTRAQVSFRLTGRATLLWNLTQRRVQGFELNGTEEITREIDIGGGTTGAVQTERANLKGPLKLVLSCGPPRIAEANTPSANLPPEPEPEPDKDGDQGGGR